MMFFHSDATFPGREKDPMVGPTCLWNAVYAALALLPLLPLVVCCPVICALPNTTAIIITTITVPAPGPRLPTPCFAHQANSAASLVVPTFTGQLLCCLQLSSCWCGPGSSLRLEGRACSLCQLVPCAIRALPARKEGSALLGRRALPCKVQLCHQGSACCPLDAGHTGSAGPCNG